MLKKLELAQKIRISPKNLKKENQYCKTQGSNHQPHAWQPNVLTITPWKLIHMKENF